MSSSSDDSDDSNSSSSSSDSSDNEETSNEQEQQAPPVKEEEKKSPTPVPKSKKRARSRSRDHSREKKRERGGRRRRRDDDRNERTKLRRRSRERGRGRNDRDRRKDVGRKERDRRPARRYEVKSDSDSELEGQCKSPPPPECLRNPPRRRKRRKRSPSPRTDRQKQERRLAQHFPELTRIARRLYVGNFDAKFEYTKEMLKDYFTRLCKERGIKSREPVKSIWIAVEKTFCFVEFRAVRDAEKGIEAFKGAEAPCGRIIRVGRPKNYEPPPRFLKNYAVGDTPPRIPRDFDITQIDFSHLENFGNQDYNSSFNMFAGRNKRSSRNIPMLPLPGKGSFKMQQDHPDATRVVMLESRVFKKELSNPAGQKQLLAEIRAECKTFGKVLEAKCSEKHGQIFVKYNTIDSSVKCKQGLDKKLFNHSKMTVSFFR